MARIDQYLLQMVKAEASDLHLASGSPPLLRVKGELLRTKIPPISPKELHQMIKEILDDRQKETFKENRDIDFSYQIPEGGRFRDNAYVHFRGLDAVFRFIPGKIPTISELGLPQVVIRFTQARRGLLLVTGPAGCGKSTTQAKHVLTIEDPIEFVHRDKKSHITQREIGQHTSSFAAALRVAMREDPDVILVGEMRDLETMSLTLSAAETGTLVFATVHTNSAAKTIDRIVDVFPASDQEHARLLLSSTLSAVVSQQLMPTKNGKGRVVAAEVMVCNSAIKNMIREGKTYQIPSAIVSGAKEGMVSMDQSLKSLLDAGTITGETAYVMAVDKEAFENTLGK